MDSVNLATLPEEVLVRIVSLISEAKPCTVSADAFHVTCDATTWRNLNSLRSTCRALRNACSKAVVGLEEIEVAEQWRKPSEGEMDFDTAMSLPCLFELNKACGGGVRDLITLRRGLRFVEFDGDTEAKWSLCRSLVKSGCENLEIVCLSNVSDGPTSLLLGNLKKGLRELFIENCSKEVPVVSEDAISTMRCVMLRSCGTVSSWLESFAQAPLLRKMETIWCEFSHKSLKIFINNANVESLSLTVHENEDEDGDGEEKNSCVLLQQALLDGALERLEELILDTHRMKDPHKLAQVLPSICAKLKKLELNLFHGLDVDWILPIAHINYGEDCEVRLQLFDHQGALEDFSVRPLLPLKNLTSVFLCFYDDVEDIVELANFPKLRSIQLTCYVDYKSVVKLAHSLKASTDLTINDCFYVENSSQKILNHEKKSVVTLDDIKNGRMEPPRPASIPVLIVP